MDLRLEEVDVPRVTNKDVLIRIDYTSICATDRHIYFEGLMAKGPPLTIGHELAGKIVEIGSDNATDRDGLPLREGDLVTIEALDYCGRCYFCIRGEHHLCLDNKVYGVMFLDGTFAEFMRASCNSVHKLSNGISPRQGCIVEPSAVAVHAVRMATTSFGNIAFVYGAGPIGLLILQAARAAGADKIIVSEVSEMRADIAYKLGADIVVNPKREDVVARVKEETDGLGADVVFEAIGQPKLQQESLDLIKKRGMIVIVGLTAEKAAIDFNKVVSNEIKIQGSWCYSFWPGKPNDFRQAMSLMTAAKIKVDPIITHEFPLTQFREAFDASQDSENAIKVIFKV